MLNLIADKYRNKPISIVCDEAHMIKNLGTKPSKTAAAFSKFLKEMVKMCKDVFFLFVYLLS